MYLIGPTSASNFLYSASIVYFSSVSKSISALAFLIFNNSSSTSSVLLSVSTVPISVLSLLMTLLESAISCSAILRSLFISSFAAVIIGESFSSILVIVCNILSRLAISPSR